MLAHIHHSPMQRFHLSMKVHLPDLLAFADSHSFRLQCRQGYTISVSTPTLACVCELRRGLDHVGESLRPLEQRLQGLLDAFQ